MKTNFKFRIPKPLSILASVSLLLTICLAACNKNNDTNQAGTSAYVMAVNSAQTSAPQDFYVDNAKLNGSAVAYTQNTDYVSTGSGAHNAQFRTAGTATVNSSFGVSFAPSSYNTVFLADDNTATVTQDDRTAPQSGKARVRFINLSSALNSNVDFGLAAGAKIVSGLAYKAVSTYYEVDAASSFSLYAAGSTTVALSIPTTLQAGHIYTIYTSGSTIATITYHIVAQN